MAKNIDAIVTAASMLSNAYGWAKKGNSKKAGKLFVQAAEDGALDEVMDGLATSVEDLEKKDALMPPPGDSAPASAPLTSSARRRAARLQANEDVIDVEDEEDGDEEDTEVELPASVARLAARTLV
jgi:hypothetical protein